MAFKEQQQNNFGSNYVNEPWQIEVSAKFRGSFHNMRRWPTPGPFIVGSKCFQQATRRKCVKILRKYFVDSSNGKTPTVLIYSVVAADGDQR